MGHARYTICAQLGGYRASAIAQWTKANPRRPE
ncbi:hypothetical protein BRAS3843_1090033 [Bradyrhizobium sp. STM 3843]|nr:hypothetical protein BRAS3843_1090033 [Bradyrhizobium sp. STM 3843]